MPLVILSHAFSHLISCFTRTTQPAYIQRTFLYLIWCSIHLIWCWTHLMLIPSHSWEGMSEKVSVRRYQWEGMSEKVSVLDCALLHSSDARSWEHIQDVDTYVECTCSTHLMSEAEEEDTCMCCTRQSSCAQIWCRFRQRVVVLGVTRCCYSVDMCTYKYLDICVYVNM